MRSVNNVLGIALALAFLTASWTVSLRLLVRGTVNRAGRHVVAGAVVGHSTHTWYTVTDQDPYELCYLSIDDGRRTLCEGWEVPREVYDRFPDGTEAKAVVSRDGRYLYSIAHTEASTAFP